MIWPFLSWSKRRVLAMVFCIGFATLGIGLAVTSWVQRKPPNLRMSAGPESTRRHTMAAYFCEKAAQNDISVAVVPSAGSEDCLNQLRAGSLDLAIVNNGVIVPNHEDIMVLGALQPEVVHILVRRELSGTAPLAERIRGKRVNLGEKGSTDWLLARELLALSRLNLPTPDQAGDIVPTHYGKADLIDKARAILRATGTKKQALIAELPDCVPVVAPIPSTVVQLLIESADYLIEPFPGARAFLADNLQDDNTKATFVNRLFLESAVLPAHSYFTTQGFPACDCETIGMRLLVVARRDVPNRAIRPLMRTLFEREFGHLAQPKSPRDLATPYAIHPAASAYLDRDKPLAVKAAMEWITQSLSLIGAFTAGALSLYGLVRWKKVRKPSDYFAEIRRVEQLAYGGGNRTDDSDQPEYLAEDFDERLMKLRQELIEDICEGRIKGDHVIANILTLLKDVRRNLPTSLLRVQRAIKKAA